MTSSHRARRSFVAAAVIAAGVAGATLLAPAPADAFCGFYVGGAGAKLFNDATVVVLMREGTRTVLSMQNAYKGPPEKFAMVVPVPVVLQEENVKTLKKEIFDHLDQLASPRLVEYWEQDPCAQMVQPAPGRAFARSAAAPAAAAKGAVAEDLGVKIEAQFTVGEYQIVILSAQDSGGLDTWLHREGYNIPEGGEPYFRPYVASGSKFFVAKVDVTKVKMENGIAQLSPLRFHYDSDEFKLPVRLGLINSSGTQDLIIHILSRGTRYEVANYPNVTIPTNLDVSEAASESFGTFYTTLFDRTLEKNPKAVVTEYAWEPTSCDPCPGPPMDFGDLTTLGIDVLPSTLAQQQQQPMPSPIPVKPGKPTATCDPPFTIDAQGRKKYKLECLDGTGGGASPPPPSLPSRRFNPWQGGSFVLTRLHARYTKESLGEDLTFKAAPGIVGGREMMGAGGKLETGAQPSSLNNFQARYAVRHGWTGPIDCKEPRRGIWGGKPGGNAYDKPAAKSAQKLGLAPHTSTTNLASYVRQDIPEIGFTRSGSSVTAAGGAGAGAGAGVDGGTVTEAAKKGCLGCAMTTREGASSGALLAALSAIVLAVRRKRRAS